MARWKPKTTREKFLAELQKLDTKISSRRAELVELESTRKQLEMVVNALSEVTLQKVQGKG
jgi:Tfp pilus assembly protein PilN